MTHLAALNPLFEDISPRHLAALNPELDFDGDIYTDAEHFFSGDFYREPEDFYSDFLDIAHRERIGATTDDYYREPGDVTRGIHFFDLGEYYREPDDVTRGISLDLGSFPYFEDFFCRQDIPIEAWKERIVAVGRCFTQEDDHLASSSMEDYKSNLCAICQQSNLEWDLWQSCHHLFCQDCSTEMLSRGMNCPLCRTNSAMVLRGRCFEKVGTVNAVVARGNNDRGCLNKKQRRHTGRRKDNKWQKQRITKECGFASNRTISQFALKCQQHQQQRFSRGGNHSCQRRC